MAEPLPTSTDKLLTVPPYPDGLQQVKLERLSDEKFTELKSKFAGEDAHHTAAQLRHVANAGNLAAMRQWHITQETVYVRQGSFQFPRDMDYNNTLVHLYLNSYDPSYCGNKNDNTSFNFWDAHGRICLHIFFRRHQRKVIFNEMLNGHWCSEVVIDFPDCIKDRKRVDLQVWTGGSKSTILFNTEGWE
ncbi:hypothetical protein IFM61606_10611 [Aspergillus udagawae]|uniref:Galectin domain-containing protein n=1 Tax=Aspergillus udagawae TaxID=91492 RepID=A0ABQ1B5E6_9EURO|nr:hypothetical protein IFM61606_10611 [Aspergillus udagawae]GFF52761.1 hypothetical protein IFM51744_07931 [Aspergillus udagawae]GFF94096.1 hypothetical protein IFM53868_07424 [Aspergillus udagawae]GFG19334.1 hypothetical protein IFM5058_09966 [Aspergillus udagawae]